MNFYDAMELVEYRYSFPDLPDFHNLRTRWLLDRTQLTLPRRVTVAGSMGKASTARLLGFILRHLKATVVLGQETVKRGQDGGLRMKDGCSQSSCVFSFSEFFKNFVGGFQPGAKESARWAHSFALGPSPAARAQLGKLPGVAQARAMACKRS